MTLLEIIIAMIIISLVVAGLAGVFVAGKRHLLHSRERIVSSELGKLFMDPFQLDVRQDTWDQAGNKLNVAAGVALEAQKINNTDYSAAYDVTEVSGTDLRRVIVNVNWTELTP